MIPKIIFALSFFLFALQNSFAQVGQARHQWALGANVGLNMNRIDFTPAIAQATQIGPTLGLTARYTSEVYFGMICALQMELNYTRAGWREQVRNNQGTSITDQYTRHMDYLQVSILAHLGFGREEKGGKVFLLLGPQMGYKLGEKEIRSQQWTLRTRADNSVIPDRSNDVYQQYGKATERPFDYGITAGLGLEWSNRLGHFLIDLRYYYGLADIFNNAKRDPFSRSANGMLGLKLSYLMKR